MKKGLSLLLCIAASTSLSACSSISLDSQLFAGSTAETSSTARPSSSSTVSWLTTKTGQFYSQFEDGNMYMEYEIDLYGSTVSVITAISKEKIYTTSTTDALGYSAVLMDGTGMYVMNTTDRTAIKVPFSVDLSGITTSIVKESDINPDSIISGTQEINGTSYESETWTIHGADCVFCFEGSDLKYIIGTYEDHEATIKIVHASHQVDDSLFIIPSDYSVTEY